MHWLYTKREVTLYIWAQFVRALSGATKCAVNGYTFCRFRATMCAIVEQNVPLKVHILSPETNCAEATKCAVTHMLYCKLKLNGIITKST